MRYSRIELLAYDVLALLCLISLCWAFVCVGSQRQFEAPFDSVVKSMLILSNEEEDDMTRVLQKPVALLAVCLLAIGCAIAATMPQQADAKDLKITAGTVFNTATDLPLTDSTLASTNKTAFNEACDNSFYKFKTSARRDSRYKLTIKSYAGQLIYATIYNNSHHRIANVKVGSESLGLFNSDDSVLAYLLHCFCDQLADLGVVSRN